MNCRLRCFPALIYMMGPRLVKWCNCNSSIVKADLVHWDFCRLLFAVSSYSSLMDCSLK